MAQADATDTDTDTDEDDRLPPETGNQQVPQLLELGERTVLDERVTRTRQAIEAATSPEDLQARFSRIRPPAPAAPGGPQPAPE